MSEEPRITNVYHFANGAVMVFDQHGQQMPEFQIWPAEEAMRKIRASGFKGEIPYGTWRRP